MMIYTLVLYHFIVNISPGYIEEEACNEDLNLQDRTKSLKYQPTSAEMYIVLSKLKE